MKIADMTPNTAYATLEGQCITTPPGKVTRGWYLVETRDGRESKTEVVSGNPRKTDPAIDDPWSTAGVHGRHPGKRILIRDGVKVIKTPYDREGRPLPSSEHAKMTVIRPENIGGTWSDFVNLHPEMIIRNFVESDGRHAAKEIQALLLEELKEKGIRFPKADAYDASKIIAGVTLWNRLGAEIYFAARGATAYTVVPEIRFVGTASINQLLEALGVKPLPPVGIQGSSPDARKREIEKLIAGTILAPETPEVCSVSDLFVTECTHCKTASV